MNPPEFWGSFKSTDYSKLRSPNEITHEDYSNCVESHPYLPLYVTGNSRGYLSLFGYNQNEDRAIDHWETDYGDVKNINPKKSTIKKIQFSNYGDKIVSATMDGSIFMHKFDNYESARALPIF